jgi:apoptosis-inducing factor 2
MICITYSRGGCESTSQTCYGVVPNSDYLGDALAPARRADGFIEVGPTLQVAGQTTVFAVGDISTADSKMAGFAGRQAAIVADNINALARDDPTSPTTSPGASLSPCQ